MTSPSAQTLVDALSAALRSLLGPEVRLPEDAEELAGLYHTALTGKRALILLDNAADGRQVRPLIPPEGCALLITSRAAIALPKMARVSLDQLQPDESRTLLTGLAPDLPEAVADPICRLCGHLPLAIRAAGSLLAVTADLDPADYAVELGGEQTRMETIGEEGVDTGVEALFNLSYARLSDEAAKVFRALAVFPASFDAAAEEAICADERHKHLSDLVRRSLVGFSPETKRYRLHDLARLFASRRSGAEERDAAARGEMPRAAADLKPSRWRGKFSSDRGK